MMRALERLGAFVATWRPDERTRARLRQHVADTIAAWVAATATTEGKALIRHARSAREPGERIALHCALARSSEVDDIHLAAMVTPGAVVVPAAVAIAASLESDRDDLAAAIAAGYEAIIRLGVAIDGPTVLYRGIWPTYFAAPFGVAAVHARLAKLDATRTAHALALALTMAAPGVGRHPAATTSRWLALGQAAAKGATAAQAAQAGFTSDLDIIDGNFLPDVYKIAPKVDVIDTGFRQPALGQVSFKPWCAARQTMAATQALKEIMSEGIPAAAIDSIDVAVLPPHWQMINHGVTTDDRFSYLTSAPFQMAVAALLPEAAYRLSPLATAPDLASFMARISIRADAGLLIAGYPHAWPAEVTVRTATGSRTRRETHVPGDPARPLGDDGLRTKCLRVVEPMLGAKAADEMYARNLAALDRPASETLQAIEEICAR